MSLQTIEIFNNQKKTIWHLQKESNGEVVDMVGWFERSYRICLLSKYEYNNSYGNKGIMNAFDKLYYEIKNK